MHHARTDARVPAVGARVILLCLCLCCGGGGGAQRTARDDALLAVYARQLIERIDARGAAGASGGVGGDAGRPLLLALALSDAGRDSSTFQAVINLVLELRVW